METISEDNQNIPEEIPVEIPKPSKEKQEISYKKNTSTALDDAKKSLNADLARLFQRKKEQSRQPPKVKSAI